MSDLVPVTESMFDVIKPALAPFSSPPPDAPCWKYLVNPPWPVEEDHRGYALMEDGNAVGFISFIYARRIINGKQEKFCNISSFVTDEAHRHEGMNLIKPVLGLQDYTVTNLTTTPTVYTLFKRLGFSDLDTTMHILLPLPSFHGGRLGRHRIIIRPEEIEERLEGQEAKDFKSHQIPNCWAFLIASQDDHCLVIFGRTKGRKRTFSFVHHLSKPRIFFENLNKAKLALAMKTRTPFVMLMDRYVLGHPIGPARTVQIRNPALYRSGSLKPEQIDSLYSELPLLNL